MVKGTLKVRKMVLILSTSTFSRQTVSRLLAREDATHLKWMLGQIAPKIGSLMSLNSKVMCSNRVITMSSHSKYRVKFRQRLHFCLQVKCLMNSNRKLTKKMNSSNSFLTMSAAKTSLLWKDADDHRPVIKCGLASKTLAKSEISCILNIKQFSPS